MDAKGLPAAPSRDAAPKAKSFLGSRLALIVFATVSGLSALSDLGSVMANIADRPDAGWAAWLMWSYVPLHAVLAIAAAILAAIGRLRAAIVAMAMVTIFSALLDVLPSALREGLDFRGFGGAITLMQGFVLPALSVAAIVLARRGIRLGFATAFAVLPTLLGAAMIVAFGISVMIYGF
ncbi:MAG: hypothetical protein AB7K04_05480 [Pseudorhodoplanes sp.]